MAVGRYITFTPAEAAHILRDMREPDSHGKRNVSRETHDRIVRDLRAFCEWSFNNGKPIDPEQPAIFSASAETDLG